MRFPTIAFACLTLAACGPADPTSVEAAPDADAADIAEAAPPPHAEVAPVAVAEPVDGAPAFVPTFPGAEVEQQAADATAASEGGMVVFTTDASPDEVVEFYKARAEAEGLASTMNMNHGDTRAYGATDAEGGETLSVVASPDGDQTSVQLTWSQGSQP
ncbi:hypothetical protein [Brevundimonas balnearis]|uniref:Lipoprotein n=1 Tax=Brevundimonas balnearis TaxID=1572858 RepID=A0ABV6R576_9CAUL